MRFPGEVWFLPPDAAEGGDAKSRRHVLLTPCEEPEAMGVFAYGSTKDTEAAFGAAYLFLDPAVTHHGRAGRTGFEQATYIYPSRLVGAGTDEMLRRVGRLGHEMEALRQALLRALGIGAGTSAGGQALHGGWRGTIVRFAEPLRREMDCSHGLIVTEPSYSRRERYQLVVPVLDLEEFDTAGMDVVVEEKEWLPSLFGASRPIAFAVEMIQAIFHPVEVETEAAVVDDETVARIEAQLLQLFELEDIVSG